MKRLRIYIITLCCLCYMACAEDKEIGEIAPLSPVYTLPQGKSPADDRIVELHSQYGTYILYEYSQLDFVYGFSTSYSYLYTLPDPQYVGDMLDLLEKIWFQYYPQEFHKKYMPYKILLADSLILQQSGQLKLKYLNTGENVMAIGYCSDTLRKMSAATKLAFKNELHKQLWNIWTYSSMEFPDEFFKVSDYSSPASKDNTSENYARARGFIKNLSTVFNSEWSTASYLTDLKDYLKTDLYTFMLAMTTRTSEAWATDIAYPLVKKKYDILQEYFLEKYNINLKQIGDATYE